MPFLHRPNRGGEAMRFAAQVMLAIVLGLSIAMCITS